MKNFQSRYIYTLRGYYLFEDYFRVKKFFSTNFQATNPSNSFFSHLLVHRLLIEQTLLRFLIRAQIDRAREFIDSCCECRPNNPPRKFL